MVYASVHMSAEYLGLKKCLVQSRRSQLELLTHLAQC
jgi:hypothetical protein